MPKITILIALILCTVWVSPMANAQTHERVWTDASQLQADMVKQGLAAPEGITVGALTTVEYQNAVKRGLSIRIPQDKQNIASDILAVTFANLNGIQGNKDTVLTWQQIADLVSRNHGFTPFSQSDLDEVQRQALSDTVAPVDTSSDLDQQFVGIVIARLDQIEGRLEQSTLRQTNVREDETVNQEVMSELSDMRRQMGDLQRTLTALTTQVGTLSQPTTVTTTDNSLLLGEITSISGQMEELRGRVDSAGSTELAAVRSDLVRLQDAVSGLNTQLQSFVRDDSTRAVNQQLASISSGVNDVSGRLTTLEAVQQVEAATEAERQRICFANVEDAQRRVESYIESVSHGQIWVNVEALFFDTFGRQGSLSGNFYEMFKTLNRFDTSTGLDRRPRGGRHLRLSWLQQTAAENGGCLKMPS
jgi:phage shock protein A